MTDRSAGSDPLSRTLRELRDAAGLRQIDAAQQTGISQSLIAKIENGRQVPRPGQVDKLCDAYRTPTDTRDRLVEMAGDLRAENQRVVMHRDRVPAQKRIGRIQETAQVQRTFSPSGIPGLLQTADYCRALFQADPNLTPEAAEAGVAARLANQAILDTDHQFEFLIPEGSLGWSLLQPTAMAEQIEHLTIAAERPNVRLGLIPWGRPAPVLPLNSWTSFDDRLVIAGTNTRVAYLTVRADLDAYRRMFDQIASLAVYDHEAQAILRGVAERYRGT